MARLPIIDPETAAGEAGRFLDASIQFRGRAPNASRSWANIPYIAKFVLPFHVPIQREGGGGVLSCRIKEMAVLKTSHVNTCDYWLAHNTALGQAAGITDEQSNEIGTDAYLTSGNFNARERAAVLWAHHVTTNTARERDDVLGEVRPHFSDAELVELTAISGLFNVSNRVHDTLQLPIEHSGEVNRIKTSVRVNTDKLKAYYESLVSMWPDDFPSTEEDPDQCAAASQVAMSERRLDEILLPGVAERIRAKGSVVPLCGPEAAKGEVASFFRLASRLYRRMPAALRAWAHIPLIGMSYIPLRLAMLHEGLGGVVSTRIKIIVVIKTSHVNGSAYCLAENTSLARVAGITDETALAIASDGYMASPLLTPGERAAISWAEQIAINTARKEEDGFAELKKHFSTAAIMELTGLCGYYNMFNRLHDSLRLPPGEEGEPEEIESAIRVDPESVKAYLKAAVENWPEAFPEPNKE